MNYHGEIFSAQQPPVGEKGGAQSIQTQTPNTIAQEKSNKAVKQEDLNDGNKQKLRFNKLVEKSQRVLIELSSVFPFDLFPDTITIDESKLNIIIRVFFFSETVHSIPIKSLKDISVETSIFFGTLKVIPDGYPGQPIIVKFLKKDEAIKARRIIQGLTVASREGIDITQIPNQELKNKIEDLGKTLR
jgi:hypothetical protein